jgi:hypothetical protein
LPSLWDRFTGAVDRINTAIRDQLAGRETYRPAPPPDYGDEPIGGPIPGGYDEPVERPTYDISDLQETEYDRPNVVVHDAQGQVIPEYHSKEEWIQIASTERPSALIDEYGVDGLDIMFSLEDDGLLDEADWEQWRDLYESLWG